MNYATQSRTPNAGALLGAFAIPAGIGAALIVGLAFTVVVTKPSENIDTFDVEPVDLPPPPPDPAPPETPTSTPQTPKPAPDPVVPTPTLVMPTSPDISVTTTPILGNDIIALPLPSGDRIGPPIAAPTPDPIPASPRGNPGNWITERDYRARWIREELSGVAAFTLEIDARGRVTDCTITRSTGHAVLDGATCRLLSRRARFTPARDPSGETVAGSFSSSVAWRIP